ncbi:hypothetical protein Hanom_Chr16g01451711 [Helianthus anomalus]
MDGSRHEVQVCSRWMRRKTTSEGDGLKRHIPFYDYFILCFFNSSIGLMIGAAFRSCEREFWYCLKNMFDIGGLMQLTGTLTVSYFSSEVFFIGQCKYRVWGWDIKVVV